MGFDDGDCVFCALKLHEIDEDDLQPVEFICCSCMEDNISHLMLDRGVLYPIIQKRLVVCVKQNI